MRIVVTRPEPGATATAQRLRAMGHAPVLLPLTEIVPLPVAARPEPSRFAAVAVTSANALRHAPAGLLDGLTALPCFAVGPRTADAVRAAGFRRVYEGSGDADALADLVRERIGTGAGVLHLAGRTRRPDFEKRLTEIGGRVTVVETYDVRRIAWSAGAISIRLGGDRADAVLLYSAEASKALAHLIGRTEAAGPLADAVLVCLSERIAAALRTIPGARAVVADGPDEDRLFAKLAGLA